MDNWRDRKCGRGHRWCKCVENVSGMTLNQVNDKYKLETVRYKLDESLKIRNL